MVGVVELNDKKVEARQDEYWFRMQDGGKAVVYKTGFYNIFDSSGLGVEKDTKDFEEAINYIEDNGGKRAPELNTEAQSKTAKEQKTSEIEKEVEVDIDKTDEVPKEKIEESSKDLDKIKSDVWESAAQEVLDESIDIDGASEDFYQKIIESLSDKLEDGSVSQEDYNALVAEIDELRDSDTLQQDLLDRLEELSQETKKENEDDDEEDKKDAPEKPQKPEAPGITPPGADGIQLPDSPPVGTPASEISSPEGIL